MFISKDAVDGFQQITALSSAASLTLPTNGPHPSWAMIQCETQAVRFRCDGIVPTASVGMRLPVGQTLFLNSNLSDFRVIEETASAKLNVSYGFGNMPVIS
jgi:hypothetical protein